MKKFRKLTAIVLALLMVLAYMPVMASAAEAGTVVGDTKLFAPPIGTYTKVKYVLKNASGEVVPDAKVVMAYSHPGVTAEGDCLILNGSTIKPGYFRMHMESADGSIVSADISPEVYANRIFLDAENAAVGDDPKIAGLPTVLNTGERSTSSLINTTNNWAGDTKAAVKEESNGNKYIYADDDGYMSFKPSWAGSLASGSARKVTMQTKIKHHGDWTGSGTHSGNYFNLSGVTSLKFTVGNANHTDKELLSSSLADGSAAASVDAYAGSGFVPTSAWADLRAEFDFENKVYSIYINDEVKFENYKMPTLTAYNLTDIAIYTCVDDFAVYSGVLYTPDLPYEIDGTSNIWLPEGKAAAIPFALKNKEDGTVVADAVYSVSGSGLEILPNGKLIVNSSTPAGTYVVSAYSPSNTLGLVATKKVTVKANKWYYDLESLEVDSIVPCTGSASTAPWPGVVSPVWNGNVNLGIVRAERDSEGNIINKYFGYPEDWIVYDEEAENYITNKSNYYYHLNHLNKSFSGKTTLEFDLLINEMTDHWHSVMKVENSAGASVLGLTYNNKNLRQGYKEDGTSYDSSSGKYFTLGKGKHHIRAEIGYETYSVWVNGTLWIDEWTNPNLTKGYINRIEWRSEIDNLMLYDGSEYTLIPSTNVNELTVPGAGSNSYTFSSVYSDGGEVSKELTYSLAEAYKGVTLEGNVLTVSSDAEMVPVVVNVTDGFVNGSVKLHISKNYIVVNGAEYEEGSDVITADGDYTIKASIGTSKNVAYYNMYIAHYEGGKLQKVTHDYQRNDKAMDLNGELTDKFTADGEAKIFIWTNNLIPVEPVKTIK